MSDSQDVIKIYLVSVHVHTKMVYFLQTNWDQVCEMFDGMNLREELLRGIYAYGYVCIY